MLLVASKIREFYKKYPNIRINDVNFEHHTYPAHMGYFQCVNQEYGKRPGEAFGCCNYVPITYISLKELRDASAERFLLVPEYIEELFHPLATVLSRQDPRVEKIFLYAIREMVRNIEEHSQADGVWFAGQYWPSYGLVEIAILDEGIGIYNSLSESGFYHFQDEEEAILMSLQPGISKAFRGKQHSDGIFDNSGYGLFMTSQVCGYGGCFTVCSSHKSLTIRNNNVTITDVAFQGTAIQMQLRVKELAKIPNLLIEISKKGTSLSKRYDGFKEPSRSSLLESLKV
jgi:hypothetical protein